MEPMTYQTGFGNHLCSEAVKGALPVGRNNPQIAPFGLYAEQLSGSAFTELPHQNQRIWLYRILPSVVHSKWQPLAAATWLSVPTAGKASPEQLRWNPIAYPERPTTFVQGIHTICTNGSVSTRLGSAVHLYACNRSMKNQCFYNADGDMLIVPQEGQLLIQTECGFLEVSPREIAVIQRGIKFSVGLKSREARGYICENYGEHFQLPYRGPIGANGLANERDFSFPHAHFEDTKEKFEILARFDGGLWSCSTEYSPFNVVAWHGNYLPYKYDLTRFNTMNTVSFDHPDPSIFTVLTSPTNKPGLANVDFVIFPPRWMVADETFRPPYFHRNTMSEYMGLIEGDYDAKPGEGGFIPGGGSLHNCMSPHGPEAEAFEKAKNQALKPEKYANTLAFMFESSLAYSPTKLALECSYLDQDYLNCWQSLRRYFKA